MDTGQPLHWRKKEDDISRFCCCWVSTGEGGSSYPCWLAQHGWEWRSPLAVMGNHAFNPFGKRRLYLPGYLWSDVQCGQREMVSWDFLGSTNNMADENHTVWQPWATFNWKSYLRSDFQDKKWKSLNPYWLHGQMEKKPTKDDGLGNQANRLGKKSWLD